jgi:GNAT superfamily N-acetyltransferase
VEAERVDVHPLTAERFADLTELFNEGGDPKWCWCQYFRKRGMNWSNSTAAANRASLERLASDGPAPGLVAYARGRAVGWVSLAPREDYARLATAKLLAPVDDTPVWSIVCFVVSRTARGRGVGAALLSAAIDYARRNGATTLEAYPASSDRGRIPAASAYQGVQSMFEKEGFEVVEVRQWNATSPPRPIMRLEL